MGPCGGCRGGSGFGTPRRGGLRLMLPPGREAYLGGGAPRGSYSPWRFGPVVPIVGGAMGRAPEHRACWPLSVPGSTSPDRGLSTRGGRLARARGVGPVGVPPPATERAGRDCSSGGIAPVCRGGTRAALRGAGERGRGARDSPGGGGFRASRSGRRSPSRAAPRGASAKTVPMSVCPIVRPTATWTTAPEIIAPVVAPMKAPTMPLQKRSGTKTVKCQRAMPG